MLHVVMLAVIWAGLLACKCNQAAQQCMLQSICCTSSRYADSTQHKATPAGTVTILVRPAWLRQKFTHHQGSVDMLFEVHVAQMHQQRMKPLTIYRHRGAVKEPHILLQNIIQVKVNQLRQAAELQLRDREPGKPAHPSAWMLAIASRSTSRRASHVMHMQVVDESGGTPHAMRLICHVSYSPHA